MYEKLIQAFIFEGQVHIEKSEWVLACRYLEKAWKLISDQVVTAELKPFLLTIHKLRATAHLGMNDFKGALLDCDNALKLDPTDQRSIFLKNQIQHKLAEKILEDARSEYGTIAYDTTQSLKQRLFAQRELLQSCGEAFATFDIDSTVSDSYLVEEQQKLVELEAVVQSFSVGIGEQDFDRALAVFDEVARRYPNFRESTYVDASNYFASLLHLEPPLINERLVKIYIIKAQICHRLELYGDAILNYDQALKLDATNIQACYECSLIKLKFAELEDDVSEKIDGLCQALEYCNRAISSDCSQQVTSLKNDIQRKLAKLIITQVGEKYRLVANDVKSGLIRRYNAQMSLWQSCCDELKKYHIDNAIVDLCLADEQAKLHKLERIKHIFSEKINEIKISIGSLAEKLIQALKEALASFDESEYPHDCGKICHDLLDYFDSLLCSETLLDKQLLAIIYLVKAQIYGGVGLAYGLPILRQEAIFNYSQLLQLELKNDAVNFQVYYARGQIKESCAEGSSHKDVLLRSALSDYQLAEQIIADSKVCIDISVEVRDKIRSAKMPSAAEPSTVTKLMQVSIFSPSPPAFKPTERSIEHEAVEQLATESSASSRRVTVSK